VTDEVVEQGTKCLAQNTHLQHSTACIAALPLTMPKKKQKNDDIAIREDHLITQELSNEGPQAIVV